MKEPGKSSVLVVDDESSNILALTEILAPDLTVFAAKNGADAIKAAQAHMPTIILLDIIMPDMDGYAVLSTLKESEKTKNIPVILLSALSDGEDIERGLALGASDYIQKPWSPVLVKLRVLNQIKLSGQFHVDGCEHRIVDTALSARWFGKDTRVVEEMLNRLMKRAGLMDAQGTLKYAIAGLDLLKGVKRNDCDARKYLTKLRIFVSQARLAMDKIERIDEENLNDYVIAIHGLKGKSFDIFASEINENTIKLESAARKGNLNYIRSHNSAFVKTMWDFIYDLEAMFSDLDLENEHE